MSDVHPHPGSGSGDSTATLLDDLERLTVLFGEMQRLCGRLSHQLTEITGRDIGAQRIAGGRIAGGRVGDRVAGDRVAAGEEPSAGPDGDERDASVERRALSLAGRYGRLTTVQLAEHLERPVTEIRGVLGRLVDDGALVRHGRGRGTFYTVAEAEAMLGTGPQAEQAQVRRVLALARARDRITTADVQREVGLSQLHARKLLARMVEQGVLARHGQRRGTHFVLVDQGDDGPEAKRSRRRPPALSIEELIEAGDE